MLNIGKSASVINCIHNCCLGFLNLYVNSVGNESSSSTRARVKAADESPSHVTQIHHHALWEKCLRIILTMLNISGKRLQRHTHTYFLLSVSTR